MTDIVDKATRSRMMRGIRGKDTKPEMRLRRAIRALGKRYRLHVKGLPGKPDLVFPGKNVVVFVHGCFWHRHVGCRYSTNPASNEEYWQNRFEENVARDVRTVHELQSRGWRVATVWECALRNDEMARSAAAELLEWSQATQPILEIGAATTSAGLRAAL